MTKPGWEEVQQYNHPSGYVLVTSEYNPDFQTFAELPPDAVNYVRRSLGSARTNDEAAAYADLETRRDEAIASLQDLVQHDVKISPTYIQVGARNGRPDLSAFTMDLHTPSLLDSDFLDPEIAEKVAPKFDSLISGLVGYFTDKFETGETSLDDVCALRQYVYAPIKDGEDADINLVDTEPRKTESNAVMPCLGRVYALLEMIEGMEKRLPEGTSLATSREEVAKLTRVVRDKFTDSEDWIADSLDKLEKKILGEDIDQAA